MMKSHWLLLVSLVLAPFVSPAATNTPIVWVQAYEAVALPGDSKPGWIRYGDGQSSIEDGSLVLSSSTSGAEYHMIRGGKGDRVWDGSQGATIEFRMRAREKSANAVQVAEFTLGDGQRYYTFALTNTALTTYRLVLTLHRAQLSVEKNGKFLVESVDTGREFADAHAEEDRNYIYFGDGSGATGGVSEWKYIRWTHSHPTPPR